MAKRKRLTLPDPAPQGQSPLETKVMLPLGVARHAAPIADVARDSAATAALEELTNRWVAARDGGRLVLALPHDAVDLDYLQRDRVAINADDMASLENSLAERGQQTPIEVVALPDGAGYGLLSGWRRCQALRLLHANTGEARFATVQALLRQPSESADAYRTMVDENEIRANLSHYERARIVIKATQSGVFEDEATALSTLFGSIPRARRSKIRSFLVLVHALDGALKFPERISERAGLTLVQRLQAEESFGPRLRAALLASAPADVEAEKSALKRILNSVAMPQKETDKDASVSTARPETDDLAVLDGLRLRRTRGGALLLSGSKVTEALTRDLIDWLASQ